MQLSFSPVTVFAAIIFSLGIIVNEVSAEAIDTHAVAKAHRSMVKIASRSQEAKRQRLWLDDRVFEEPTSEAKKRQALWLSGSEAE
ncbi:hypothetical protein C8R44DRAFT_893247 [Mycena epipterygia]|nr:hypothetical protein C8R44DRAFT_893247 [Mycena epipterygia]